MENQRKSMVWRRKEEDKSQKYPLHQQRMKKARQLREKQSKLSRLQKYLPYLETMEKGSTYAKLYKASIRKKIEATVKQSLPQKKKDPGCFKVALRIGDNKEVLSMLDLGATENLMPYHIYTQLGLEELKPTDFTLEMADNSIKTPKGIVENVIVRIFELIVPVDFLVIDTEVNENQPVEPEVLLGRSFMATTRTNIDVYNGDVTMTVQGKTIRFNAIDNEPCIEVKIHKEEQLVEELQTLKKVEIQMCQILEKVCQHQKRDWHSIFKSM